MKYLLENVGRSKWTGTVEVRGETQEQIEAAIYHEARKHLMSQDVDFEGTDLEGEIIVGRMRSVGTYKRIEEAK
ncbi:MAG: hypothetical protein QME77_13200 [bacterium]|nr:hypothetical protein [bacterium]